MSLIKDSVVDRFFIDGEWVAARGTERVAVTDSAMRKARGFTRPPRSAALRQGGQGP